LASFFAGVEGYLESNLRKAIRPWLIVLLEMTNVQVDFFPPDENDRRQGKKNDVDDEPQGFVDPPREILVT
jgi:hypothetical protein